SIDYAVMEKTKNATVVAMDAGWSDVGSWSALWEVSEKDSDDNVTKGDIIAVNSKSNYLLAENKLIATVGIDNLIVVETKDAILVADKEQVQDVKSVVNHLKESNRTEHRVHREVYRPWGKYDSIDLGTRDQVKRITGKPGEKLSIQM
ncbi:mannose-1-phosphate guanyltransferase, partial [Vibrio xuii]